MFDHRKVIGMYRPSLTMMGSLDGYFLYWEFGDLAETT